MAILEGNEVWSNNTPTSQVYQATHEGEHRLSFMNRSFISFTFGDKSIEDFGLIATTSGNRMEKSGYASFDDISTTYNTLPGQFYWGTYYKSNSIKFDLSTDGMTQRQLDDFVYWFAAGEIRELVLSEHPNRAIMAHVSSPPSLSLLPFEKKISVPLGDGNYNTSTTLYKGEIKLELVMDDPHWYSKINIFGYPDINGIYQDKWTDANGNEVSVYDDPDAIKIAYEDGIPFSSMLSTSMLLGDDIYANVDYLDCMKIATMTQEYEINSNIAKDIYVKGAVIADDSFTGGTPITVVIDEVPQTPFNIYQDVKNGVLYTYEEYPVMGAIVTPGLIAGPVMSNGEGIIELAENTGASAGGQYAYFYYSGTAPSPTELSFTLMPTISNYYISTPNNSYAKSSGTEPYNTIIIESLTKQEIRFTTCNFFTSFNKVIQIFAKLQVNQDWVSVREDIRKDVHHAAVRAWANKIIDYFDQGQVGTISSSAVSNARAYMAYMIMDVHTMNIMKTDYIFNSKTGKAIAKLRYRQPTDSLPTGSWVDYGIVVEKEEDVGDMLKSNYLIIRDRNYPDETSGSILQWSASNKRASHRIYHDVNGSVYNVKIKYKNLYL